MCNSWQQNTCWKIQGWCRSWKLLLHTEKTVRTIWAWSQGTVSMFRTTLRGCLEKNKAAASSRRALVGELPWYQTYRHSVHGSKDRSYWTIRGKSMGRFGAKPPQPHGNWGRVTFQRRRGCCATWRQWIHRASAVGHLGYSVPSEIFHVFPSVFHPGFFHE